MLTRSFTALGFVLLGSACVKQSGSSSTIKHDAGKLVLASNPTYWAQNVTRAIFEKSLKEDSIIRDENGKIIWAHPVLERLQVWIDLMDTAARQTTWGKQHMAATPKPQIVLLESSIVNAASDRVLVKYPAYVSVEGTFNSAEAEQNSYALRYGIDGKLEAQKLEYLVAADGDSKQLADVVARLSSDAKILSYSCLPKLEGSEKVVFTGCKKPDWGPRSASYRFFVSQQTAPYITITTETFRVLNESEIVALVAHELGHYYRAHPTENTQLTRGFIYEENQAGQGARPHPTTDQNLEKLGRKMLSEFKDRIPPSLPNTTLDSQVVTDVIGATALFGSYSDGEKFGFNGDPKPYYELIEHKCKATRPLPNNCHALRELVKGAPVSEFLNQGLPPNDRKTYDALEKALLDATSNLKAVSEAGAKSLTMSSPEIDVDTLFLGKPSRKVCSSVVTKGSPISFHQLMSSCSQKIAEHRKATDALMSEVTRLGIGWYTGEQEADEIAPELLASVGLDPIAGADSLWAIFKHSYENNLPNNSGLDYPSCQKVAKDRFGFGTAHVRAVALADWSEDPHHDLCYRIYNITREVFSHNYKWDVNQKPKFSKTWTEMVNMVPK